MFTWLHLIKKLFIELIMYMSRTLIAIGIVSFKCPLYSDPKLSFPIKFVCTKIFDCQTNIRCEECLALAREGRDSWYISEYNYLHWYGDLFG